MLIYKLFVKRLSILKKITDFLSTGNLSVNLATLTPQQQQKWGFWALFLATMSLQHWSESLKTKWRVIWREIWQPYHRGTRAIWLLPSSTVNFHALASRFSLSRRKRSSLASLALQAVSAVVSCSRSDMILCFFFLTASTSSASSEIWST